MFNTFKDAVLYFYTCTTILFFTNVHKDGAHRLWHFTKNASFTVKNR